MERRDFLKGVVALIAGVVVGKTVDPFTAPPDFENNARFDDAHPDHDEIRWDVCATVVTFSPQMWADAVTKMEMQRPAALQMVVDAETYRRLQERV